MKKKNKSNIKVLAAYFKPYKYSLIIMTLITFISYLGIIFTGYLIGAATESAVNLLLDRAIMFLLIYLLINLTIELTTTYVDNKLNLIQIKVSRTIGYDTYKKVLKLPAYAFEELSTGEIINRVSNDTETIVGSADRLINIISRFLSAIIILVIVFYNAWIVGVEILLFLGLYGIFVKIFAKKLKEYNEKTKKQNDLFSAVTNESVRGVREIKTLGIRESLVDEIKTIVENLYEFSKKECNINSIYSAVSTIMKSIVEVGTFITTIYLLCNGLVSLTFFMAFTYYIYRFTWLIENVTEASKTYEKLKVALNRIGEILSNNLYDDVSYGTKELDNVKGIIEFKNVTFNYKNESKIFNKFNIKFEPNKKIAIVGASGGGKTTIFNLLTRLFEPTSGAIYLDGVKISELTEDNLRKNISIIRQEPFIFNRTILENFQVLKKDVTLDDVRKYCKKAYIDDYIMSLPKKYDSIIGEGGVNLSGGQKQRLAIARTLMKESKVILFDEATSALDNESQKYIKESIDELSKNHTVIIVAHRLSTIVDADTIYVLKSGKVIATGKHNELIKTCDYYRNLYTTESKIK